LYPHERGSYLMIEIGLPSIRMFPNWIGIFWYLRKQALSLNKQLRWINWSNRITKYSNWYRTKSLVNSKYRANNVSKLDERNSIDPHVDEMFLRIYHFELFNLQSIAWLLSSSLPSTLNNGGPRRSIGLSRKEFTPRH